MSAVIQLLKFTGNRTGEAENTRIRRAIERTVRRIPDLAAQEFAFGCCHFISVSPEYPAYCGAAAVGSWLVLISELCPDEYLEHVIAHEIAHGFAGWRLRGLTGLGDLGAFTSDESAANALMVEWGFAKFPSRTYKLSDLVRAWEKRNK